MLESILTVLSSQLAKETVANIYKWLSARSLQRSLKEMQTDLCLDMIEEWIEVSGGSQEQVKEMRKTMQAKVKKEANVRMGAIFKAFKR